MSEMLQHVQICSPNTVLSHTHMTGTSSVSCGLDINLHFIRLCKLDITAPDSIRPQQSTFLPQPGEDEILMEKMAEIEGQKPKETIR